MGCFSFKAKNAMFSLPCKMTMQRRKLNTFLSLSQLLETLSFGGVDDTSEEEEAVVKVWFRPTV